MYPKIKYISLDGRGDDENFQTCVLDTIKKLQKNEGLHVIKDFEPFPLYSMMEQKGYNKYLKKISEEEYHVWFFPQREDLEMKKYLNLDTEKLNKIKKIKIQLFRKELSVEEAKKKVNEEFEFITPEEFAYGEQDMTRLGVDDDQMVDRMDDIIAVFEDVLEKDDFQLPEGHPISTYLKECVAIEELLKEIEKLRKSKFIKNQWLEKYEKLNEINIHFSRKQNQLFSLLEQKGFDRPSKVMWTFDNKVRDAIKEAFEFLRDNKDQEFLNAQENVIFLVKDILEKERSILYPTAIKLISEEEFANMRVSDDEIGYCLIDTPQAFKLKEKKPEQSSLESSSLINDLQAVLTKHGVLNSSSNSDILDVSMGKLNLEQINLIFKHLQVDLSYVDENEIVKFYSDTKHRVFPRSAGVIGRKVQNCHPRESVETVEKIIEAFRKGEQDKAEFWLEMGGKFIYIIYNAVRDEQGNFRGVLEMMQDVTHIRSLTGSQKLLSWDTPSEQKEAETIGSNENTNDIVDKNTIIAPLLKKYPNLKTYLISLSPKYKKLNNPVVFNTMGNVASLEMIAKRGGFEVDEFVEMIKRKIEEEL